MRGLLPLIRPRRRRGWIWVALTGGIVLNGLRLRDRLARIPALPEPSEPRPPVDAPLATELTFITAAGVTVDPWTQRDVIDHAKVHGLRVVDIVPADLPVEQALDLGREVDTTTYRTTRLARGRGALHAIAIDVALADRLALPREEGLDAVEMAVASIRAKQCAPTTTDLVVAPLEHAVPMPVEQRLPYLRALAGTAAPVATAMPAAQYALMAAGLVLSPGWGLASLVASALQPWLATAGTALAPADRTPGQSLRRAVDRPVNAIKALRSTWEPAVVVAADPRFVAALAPVYAALLADGTDRFLEPKRDDCPLCGCGDLSPVIEVGDLLQHKPGTFHLESCPGCGHIFQNPRLTVEGLDFYYRDFYDGLAADEAEFLFGATDKAYLDRVRMVARTTGPRRWLDIGGGHGHFCLIAAGELPATQFDGLDMSDSIDEAARRGWVTNGYRGMFPELAPELAGAYDVVSMHHYLEHTREPLEELDAARIALEPGGHLLIELPDPDCGFSRIMGPLWGPWFQPQHQHFLSVTNLRRALEDRGFTVVDEERGPAHQPAELSYFLWLLLQRTAPPPKRPWLPDPTPAQRIQRVATFAAFGPAFLLAVVADNVLAPLVRRTPNGPNAFRILARRD